MKKFLALILAALMLLSCAAMAEGFEIVVVPKDASNPWFVRKETDVNEYATAHPEDTIYQKGTPEIDPTLQSQLVMDLVAQDVDSICVVPVDLESIEPALKAARDAGIVVIAHDAPRWRTWTTTSRPSTTSSTAPSSWTTWPPPWARRASTPRWSPT